MNTAKGIVKLLILCAAGCSDPVYFGALPRERSNPETDGSAANPSGTRTLRVFETSSRFNGDLRAAGKAATALAGADALCQLSAESASLGGTWRAYIATTSMHAIDRIPSGGAWQTMETTFGPGMIKDAAAFTQPIAHLSNERGQAISSSFWSGAGLGGRSSGVDCDSWTTAGSGTQGHNGTTTSPFTGSTFDSSCEFESPLLCFELP